MKCTCETDELEPGRCVPCRLAAEAEMYRSGEYNPAADPFLDTRPATAAINEPWASEVIEERNPGEWQSKEILT